MENYFIKLFDKIHYERSLILLLSITDPDILKQSKLRDDEISIIKNLALEKRYRQRLLKEYYALHLLDEQIDDNI